MVGGRKVRKGRGKGKREEKKREKRRGKTKKKARGIWPWVVWQGERGCIHSELSLVGCKNPSVRD